MNKIKVEAFCVMESPTESLVPTNVKTVKTINDLFYVTFDSILQRTDNRNRNGRIYEGRALWESLNAPHIKELIANESWCGEAGHPMSNETKRILTIDPKLTSHRIYNLQKKGDIISGTIDTLLGGYGDELAKRILQRLEAAFSLRALAPIQRINGQQYIKGKSHVVCYDRVILPSHPEAYKSSKAKIQSCTESLATLGNSLVSEGGRVISITESQIIDFIAEESMNVNKISDIFEVAKESMVLSKDLKHVIMKEGTDTYYVKIEDKIKRDINNYMSKF